MGSGPFGFHVVTRRATAPPSRATATRRKGRAGMHCPRGNLVTVGSEGAETARPAPVTTPGDATARVGRARAPVAGGPDDACACGCAGPLAGGARVLARRDRGLVGKDSDGLGLGLDGRGLDGEGRAAPLCSARPRCLYPAWRGGGSEVDATSLPDDGGSLRHLVGRGGVRKALRREACRPPPNNPAISAGWANAGGTTEMVRLYDEEARGKDVVSIPNGQHGQCARREPWVRVEPNM